MSKFAIYKSTRGSFRTIRIVNRTLYVSVIILWVLMTTVAQGEYQGPVMKAIDVLINVLFFTALASVLIFTIYIRRSVVAIGEITVNLTKIEKSVGGISWVYDLNEIEELNIRKQSMAFLLAGNRDSTSSYLVTLRPKGKPEERFVISSQSSDKPEVNFVETLQKLEKLSKISFKITK